MFKKTTLVAAILCIASFSAHALPITYTFTGNGDFSVGNSAFEDSNFAVTILGDTTNVGTGLFGAGIPAIGGLNATFGWNGLSASFLNTTYVFDNHNVGSAGRLGFGIEGVTSFDLLTLRNDAAGLDSYDLVSNLFFEEIAPSSTRYSQWLNIGSTGGEISMRSINVASFTAQVQNASGIPEPSSIAILGLGLAGLAVARRKAI